MKASQIDLFASLQTGLFGARDALWVEFDVEMDRLCVIMNEGREPDIH
jgi:hypothetical protein